MDKKIVKKVKTVYVVLRGNQS